MLLHSQNIDYSHTTRQKSVNAYRFEASEMFGINIPSVTKYRIVKKKMVMFYLCSWIDVLKQRQSSVF